MNEIEFDIIVAKFDRLKTTKRILNEIKHAKQYVSRNNLSENFNFTKSYQRYKQQFNKFLNIKEIKSDYNDKWLSRHYEEKFKKSGSTYVKKTKVFWFWIALIIVLSIIFLILLVLGLINII